MRIVLMGQAAFGAETLRALLAAGHEVVAVYTSPAPKRSEALLEVANDKHLPIFQPRDLRSKEVLESLRHFEPDLGVMAFVTRTIPIEVLNCPRLGTIQYHPSLLPRHRGASAINWAIIQGETETGLTYSGLIKPRHGPYLDTKKSKNLFRRYRVIYLLFSAFSAWGTSNHRVNWGLLPGKSPSYTSG